MTYAIILLGPNKGRQFYVCPTNPQCEFFKWADEAAQESHRTTSTTTYAISQLRTHMYSRSLSRLT